MTGSDEDRLRLIAEQLKEDYPDLEGTLRQSGGRLLLGHLLFAITCLCGGIALFVDPVVGFVSFYLCCLLLAIGGTEASIRMGQLYPLHQHDNDRVAH